ncbi:MAG: GlsB/YeaQ/YmgE family stress response membrane protein [Porphyromonas sp.]|uniref:GlsB/YeaQ/YmgE family stress response membrane protein n=1 Tax=Porphyromonas sp. TaxID=1924944 RepID=UPI002A74E489|nr:GlsB/YeaQ/YmgE family stress response membrane protein [Porphyromonas sp.]MDY3112040.1 GlsB/YeaQ/YmgE family stress response membrane protein [Porphyromonas sp.]
MGLLWSLLIGLAAGAIAGWIMRGRSLGCLWNIIIGMLGGVVGGWVYSFFGAKAGDSSWAQLVCAVVGACVILLVVGLFNKRKR